MKRREFLTTAGLAGAASMGGFAGAGESDRPQPAYLEMKQYHFLANKRRLVNDFFRQAKIPALNRIGIKPVGVFEVLFGPNRPTLTLLIPHTTLESVVTVSQRLLADDDYLRQGREFVDASASDPAFVRAESSLLLAFSHMPQIEVPPQATGNQPRIFELRTYESHSMKAGKKKIEMFNEGGEIEIFRNTGLRPVFFAETIAGPRLPNLTYMLAFSDMAERETAWDTFRKDPAWRALSKDPQYAGTVSNITDVILRPAAYSQI